MGRPTVDPSARKLSVAVAPPAELDADMRALWHREFARFPAGYFVPSDVRGMLLYLDALRVYERARMRLDIAEEAGAAGAPLSKECRQALLVVHKLQRDLRMYPATRTHREIHGSLANNPTTQTTQPNEAEGWRGLFAVPNVSTKKRGKQ